MSLEQDPERVLGPWRLNRIRSRCYHRCRIISITGTVAAGYTGPAITLSFAIAAIGCCFAGLCYAEFASMIPVAGSCLYILICYNGRTYSMDYRLGSSIGIYCCRYYRQYQLEQISRCFFWKEWGSIYPMHLLLVPGTEVL